MEPPTPVPPTSLAPLLLRNIFLPLLLYTDSFLLIVTQRFKFFKILRYSLITAFLFFLKIIPSFIPDFLSFNHDHKEIFSYGYDSGSFQNARKINDADLTPAAGGSCIARALTQLLAIINEIPVSSRKYEIVRSYAEKLMHENLEEGFEPLRKVNTTVLSAAFSRALGQLESAVKAGPAAAGDGGEVVRGGDAVRRGGYFGFRRVIRRVGYYGDVAWSRFGRPGGQLVRLGASAEKLSAELLWLAQKLSACGSIEEAVCRWASASNLASLALSAQPRLQGSLVKLSVFLFKEARYMGVEDNEEKTMEELRKTKMKMLMSWLPFLCQASVGTDVPVLSFVEKSELERVLGELIESLKHEEEQEKVLSLWLHYFTHCPSSDWPNLHPYYSRWCTVSRKLLILEGK